LQTRDIEVVNVFNPHKPGFERDTVYLGLYWAAGWLFVVLAAWVASWRRADAHSKTLRIVIPLAFLFGSVCLYVQLQAMAEYADTCRRLLQPAHSGLPISGFVHPVQPLVATPTIAIFAAARRYLVTSYRNSN